MFSSHKFEFRSDVDGTSCFRSVLLLVADLGIAAIKQGDAVSGLSLGIQRGCLLF